MRGREGERLLEAYVGLVKLLQLHKRDTAVVKGIRIVGLVGDCFVVTIDGSTERRKLCEHHAEIVVSLGKIRPQAQGLPIACFRLGRPFEFI